MTTGTRIDPADREFRRWAADQLGTSPDAPATAARTAFCSLLRDADFVPPDEWHSAYRVLAVDANAASATAFGDPNIARDVQDRLRLEIDEFASEYFNLEPAERRNRWGELQVRAASFKSLVNWLDALAPGLDIRKDMTLNGPPQLIGLFEAVLRNFVVRPIEAAWHRQRFIEECQPEIGAYQYAAQQLQKRYPALAALAPDLVTQLATWSKAQREREARRKKVRAAMAQAGSTTDLKKLLPFALILIPAFIIGLSRDSSKKSRPPVQVPSYNPPPFQFKQWKDMTLEEKKSTGSAFRKLFGGPDNWKPEDELPGGNVPPNDNKDDPSAANLRTGAELLREYRELKEQRERDERERRPSELNTTPTDLELKEYIRQAVEFIEKNSPEKQAINPEPSNSLPSDIPDEELTRQRAKPKPDGD